MTSLLKFGPVLIGAVAAGVLPFAASQASAQSTTVYVAELEPMNASVVGSETTGNASLAVDGNTLTIRIEVENAPPGIVHWQHFHGFEDGSEAACPSGSADVNGDGVVDLIETEPASGTTMVPFDKNPAAMDVANGDYPEADATGTYTYEQTVPLDELQDAFASAFDGGELNLEGRVIYVHGISPDADLAGSVASLGPIPAHTTVPIACGEFAAQTEQAHGHATQPDGHSLIQIPPAMAREHEHLHEALAAAVAAGGRTGEASRAVEKVLAPHFEEENRIALPPLGLLPHLVEGGATPEMRPAIDMGRQVDEHLARFVEEHAAIERALDQLETAARAEGKLEHLDFVSDLRAHAQEEEVLLYPMTIIIGRYLQQELGPPSAGDESREDAGSSHTEE